MNFVLDAAHGERFERITSRRGVLLTIEQTALFVKATGDERMWDYDWAPAVLNPPAVVLGMKQLGVDVSAWTGERSPVRRLLVVAALELGVARVVRIAFTAAA